MDQTREKIFIEKINRNSGIAHKVVRLYFSSATEREDALQEMMYQLWRSFDQFDGRSKFSTWMYRVCLNTALVLRRNPHPSHQSIESYHLEIAAPNDNEESRQELYRAINCLSDLNKAIILLYLEGYGYDEISTVTGLSKSNVSVRLVRIRRTLEKEIRI